MDQKTINIFIADDHPIMRRGIKFMFEAEPDMAVSGEASNGEDAYELLVKKSFDIAILDVEMPKLSGLEIARKLNDLKIDSKIIFLTMYKDEDMFNQAMDIGAMGYVLKECAAEDIIDCVRNVNGGKYYISPAISSYLVNRERSRTNLAENTPSINDLTRSERIILKLIAEEKTTRQIADDLNVSYKTVENHRTNISKKLQLHGTHSLIKFAITNKHML